MFDKIKWFFLKFNNLSFLEMGSFIAETMSEVFWEKVSANDTELPYPFYCFEDRDGFSYIVVNSVPLITDQASPQSIKPYTFKEAATMIVQAFEVYLCFEKGETKEDLIEDLVQQFEHVSLVCSD